jgi:hypothetical protein
MATARTRGSGPPVIAKAKMSTGEACGRAPSTSHLDNPNGRRQKWCTQYAAAVHQDAALELSAGEWMTVNGVRRAMLAGAVLALAGCAVGRSELAIQAPKAPVLKPGAPVILIRSITDARVFEDQPKNPNVPSLDSTAKATAEVKARAVARKRNTYGHALGDVLLDNGQTVGGIIRDNLAAAFGEAGYAVQVGTAAPAGALVVDVTVRKFWAWIEPGFTQITQQIDIDAGLVFSGKGGKQDVAAHATEARAAVGDDAWRDIIQKGLIDFRKKAAATAKALPR